MMKLLENIKSVICGQTFLLFFCCFGQVLTHQVKLVLGISPSHHSGVLEFFYLVYEIFANIRQTNLVQLLISVLTITTLVLVKYCINERFK